MVLAMEQWSPMSSSLRKQNEELPEFNLREWALKAHRTSSSRENAYASSRRLSAPNMRSFREETKSFRSSITTNSSPASSPACYSFTKDEIDPSTYSFTSALRALQARSSSRYSWEWLSADGLVLNSKWNEAEKYICNPLSGEIPMECLSAKTLIHNRSMRRSLSINKTKDSITAAAAAATATVTATATAPASAPAPRDEMIESQQSPMKEEKLLVILTKEMGTQSTPPPDEISSSSHIPSTPPIEENSIKRYEVEDGEASSSSTKSKTDKEFVQHLEGNEEGTEKKRKKQGGNKFKFKSTQFLLGCLPWRRRSLWMRDKDRKPK